MTARPSFEKFKQIFIHNINARSRTARGISDTSSSEIKKELLLDGNELESQVKKNTSRLIRSVWKNSHYNYVSVAQMRALLEEWNDIINYKLQDQNTYGAEQKKLQEQIEQSSRNSKIPYRINPRYRVWNVSYSTLNVSPVDLEFWMDHFYFMLSARIRKLNSRNTISQATLLAYADHMVDVGIHPWADGCGRNSTTLVMWLSLLTPGWQLPVFGARDEHYANIADLPRHILYFKQCLSRGI